MDKQNEFLGGRTIEYILRSLRDGTFEDKISTSFFCYLPYTHDKFYLVSVLGRGND